MIEGIDYKSKLTDLSKGVQRRNVGFYNLTSEDQRREIAFDALKTILLEKKVVASDGYYWDDLLLYPAEKCKTAEKLQQFLINKLPFCSVCARGSIMLSSIRLGNIVEPEDDEKQDGDDENVVGFEMKDMIKIENAYEFSMYNMPFGAKTNEKLVNIMCNIIKNGNFSINDRTNYISKWGINL